MGCDREIICKTCKVTCYAGYGSYCSWAPVRNTLAEYDQDMKRAGVSPRTHTNIIQRWFIAQHEGHDITYTSSDWASVDNQTGHLVFDATGKVDVRDFSNYDKIDPFVEHPTDDILIPEIGKWFFAGEGVWWDDLEGDDGD